MVGSEVGPNERLLRTGKFVDGSEFAFPNGDLTVDPLKNFGLSFRDSVNGFSSMIDVLFRSNDFRDHKQSLLLLLLLILLNQLMKPQLFLCLLMAYNVCLLGYGS